MNKLNKIRYFVGSAIYMLPFLALAAGEGTGAIPDPVAGFVPKTTSAKLLIDRITGGIATVLFAISVVFFLMAGFNYLLSAGEQEKVTAAKNQLTYAIIGLAVGLLAYAIPGIIERFVATGGLQ